MEALDKPNIDSLKQIKQLKEQLKKKPRDFAHLSNDRPDYLTASEVAKKLFAKASPENLSLKTSEELYQITNQSIDLLESIVTERNSQIVVVESHPAHSAIYIAQGDRPFIINTVTELFREEGLNIQLFLHPILLHQGFKLSLAYIECEPLSPAVLAVLERKLKSALSDLRLVTEDFTSMLVKSETLARILNNPKYASLFPLSEQTEIADFLHWLTDGGYIFLGYAVWSIDQDLISSTPVSRLGLFQENSSVGKELIKEAAEDVDKIIEHNQAINVSKLRIESSVHRRNRLNNIVILESSSDGQIHSVHSIVGLFTSKALTQESSSVPLIRRKLKLLLEMEDLYENSFDFKTTVNIIDSMPKDEAFRLDLESLCDIIRTIVGIQNKNETKISIRFDPGRRGVSVLIIMPRDRFNSKVRDALQSHLEDVFGAAHESSEYHLDLTNKPHARLYFYIPQSLGALPPVDLARLEQSIADLSRTWSNSLEEYILSSKDFSDSHDIWNRYFKAFPENYQTLQSIEDAVYDIKKIEQFKASKAGFIFGLRYQKSYKEGYFSIILYHQEHEVSLSHALPILENLGLEVVNEQSAQISPLRSPTCFVHRFTVRTKSEVLITEELFENVISPALYSIFTGESENDSLNSLAISAQLSIDKINLMRTYCHLLWQVNRFATRTVFYTCLASHPKAAKLIWELFDKRFNPEEEISLSKRQVKFEKKLSTYKDYLRNVSDITYDRILRSLALLLEHTVRTSFYSYKDCIVLKLHSEQIAILPNPRPRYEIFVYSPNLQGTHLRSDLIARGGIRWSDRTEDFRSEILGLVKTQKIKNALIVPTGAKGGFVVQNLPADPKEIKFAVEQSYRRYIRALLSVVDNQQGSQVKHPDKIVVYDELDPYFVVAADKGTATFSDLANKIACDEYDFWLGDAFASGGSQGYDHKLYGITARGAWECALRHFKDIGINYEENLFSVVGIGDMSGDVFGNGLILSKNIKLVAAFNHKHIFIDPNPDPEVSFYLRKHLFDSPGSQWSDYDQTKISTGGGIFNRYDKEITLSTEARLALGLPEDAPEVLNGEQVISFILKAPCDLLWNGGIGTYVKSDSETHAEVNDGTNDRVRINASELRARVVAEGGNLGFTQLARIEYSQKGGRLNTDAIDNSAGVDLSDHEVNLKILLGQVESTDLLTREARNDLLKNVADDVVEHVLSHNKAQSLVLTLGAHRSKRNIEYFRSLIRELHRSGYINRSLESLPDDEELLERARQRNGLERPELAICLGGVKMHIKDVLIKSNLPLDPLVQPFLFEYFPKPLQKLYPEQICQHPLAKHIIATQITNYIIDTMGITFIHRMCSNYSIPPLTVINGAVAAQLILEVPTIVAEISSLDTFKSTPSFLSLRKEINAGLREASAWFFRYHKETPPSELVKKYQNQFAFCIQNLEKHLTEEQCAIFEARMKKYIKYGINSNLSRKIASFGFIGQIFEMLWIASKTSVSNEAAAEIYSSVREALNLEAILKISDQISTSDKWETTLASSALEDIQCNVSRITESLIMTSHKSDAALDVNTRMSQSLDFERFKNILGEILEKPASAAAMAVLARQIAQIIISPKIN